MIGLHIQDLISMSKETLSKVMKFTVRRLGINNYRN